MSNEKGKETDQPEAEKEKAECRENCKGCIFGLFCKEKKIINKYLDAIGKEPENYSEEPTQVNVYYQQLPFRSPRTTQIKAIIKDMRNDRIISRNKLDHYEKLYRCRIESYHAKTKRWITIALIFATAIVLCVTVALCAFGPNFKSQGNVNASAGTAFESEYKGRSVYGFTYFQETGNGRR